MLLLVPNVVVKDVVVALDVPNVVVVLNDVVVDLDVTRDVFQYVV